MHEDEQSDTFDWLFESDIEDKPVFSLSILFSVLKSEENHQGQQFKSDLQLKKMTCFFFDDQKLVDSIFHVELHFDSITNSLDLLLQSHQTSS